VSAGILPPPAIPEAGRRRARPPRRFLTRQDIMYMHNAEVADVLSQIADLLDG
jgi:hypothetical protein